MRCMYCGDTKKIMSSGMIFSDCKHCGDNTMLEDYDKSVKKIRAKNPKISELEARKMLKDEYDKL